MQPPPPNAPRFLRIIRRGLASRRSTPALAPQINAEAQSKPCFLGLAAAGITCRCAVPVQRGTPQTVIMPAEAMPRPPGSKVTSPARGNRARPVSRIVSRNVPHWAGRLYVTVSVTNVNGWETPISVTLRCER
jgi:hypothetical protein